jgi:GGDEF domain-containing protein
MSVDPGTRETPRAGPVAGLPTDSMLARADELARRWALALVIARPLDGLGDVPLEDLAREAPALCAQMVRALESDGELERLTGGHAPTGVEESALAGRLAVMSGATEATAVVEAVEALRGVLWETLLEELRWPTFQPAHARRVADIGDRLAYVCASALAAGLAADLPRREATTGDSEPTLAQPEPTAGGPDREPAVPRRGVIVDEREHVQPSRRRPPAEIEIRDERGEVGPAAWIGSIGRQLERFRRDGLSFAVLLVELGDLERMRRDNGQEQGSFLVEEIEQALASELGAAHSEAPAAGGSGSDPGQAQVSGSLTRERHGRYWLLAPDTDGPGARALAGRLITTARRLASHRGARLEIAIGTAVCPDDGREAAALAAHADVELYAARSSARATVGRPSASLDEPA